MRPLRFALLASTITLSANAADELVQNGGFESPPANGRLPVAAGGDPSKAQPTSWEPLTMKIDGEGGKLVAGLTNEVARSGKQSFFVDFQQLTAPSQWVSISTVPVAVKPRQTYRVSIWGRIDGARPVALDERRPYIWVDLQFLKADRQTASADAQLAVALIPGPIVPGIKPELSFHSWKWSESFSLIETPENTAFLQVTWTWGVPNEKGETDGATFWDDATIAEAAPAPPDSVPATTPPAGATPAKPAPAEPEP
jgi:hypothetical protein